MDCEFEDCSEPPARVLEFAAEEDWELELAEDEDPYDVLEIAVACRRHGDETIENGGALVQGMGPLEGIADWRILVNAQDYDGREVISDPPPVYRTQARPQ